MKILLCFVVISFYLSRPVLGQYRVEVIVTHVKDTTGTVRVALFANADSFLRTPMTGKIVKAVHGSVYVVFDNVPAGDYAVGIIHDSNRNGKLDTNFFGVPREGFGFSNDAMGTLGPPSFDKARFSLRAHRMIRILTRYY
jgi:uncharacterized protein (DUF2141 family)